MQLAERVENDVLGRRVDLPLLYSSYIHFILGKDPDDRSDHPYSSYHARISEDQSKIWFEYHEWAYLACKFLLDLMGPYGPRYGRYWIAHVGPAQYPEQLPQTQVGRDFRPTVSSTADMGERERQFRISCCSYEDLSLVMKDEIALYPETGRWKREWFIPLLPFVHLNSSGDGSLLFPFTSFFASFISQKNFSAFAFS
ncbi:hypothetical protein PIB30_014765 [Stylosanthes scabra]|uniref:Uncharacterized protein n=1 Tax=Stylosanthes scabra TaxID=79078 RepID=A0ABU6Y3N5_9FABA|nr:hypothetical protein [Stylosanthes scabra]